MNKTIKEIIKGLGITVTGIVMSIIFLFFLIPTVFMWMLILTALGFPK